VTGIVPWTFINMWEFYLPADQLSDSQKTMIHGVRLNRGGGRDMYIWRDDMCIYIYIYNLDMKI
jgi:hypothetical protein